MRVLSAAELESLAEALGEAPENLAADYGDFLKRRGGVSAVTGRPKFWLADEALDARLNAEINQPAVTEAPVAGNFISYEGVREKVMAGEISINKGRAMCGLEPLGGMGDAFWQPARRGSVFGRFLDWIAA